MLYGGIEAGGTKFICAIGENGGVLKEKVEIPTKDPETTLSEVFHFFSKFQLKGIGIASFGPIDIKRDSDTYGYITNSPKVKWRNFPIVQTLEQKFSVPVGFDTDVNSAVLAENRLGAAKGLDSCIYITVGTGIGVGAIINKKLLKGISHPEMGHIFVRRHNADSFKGVCPYHGDCLEGLASGPAMEQRWGNPASELEETHEAWNLEAYYLAHAIAQYILILSPKRVIIGGGVGKQTKIFPLIYKELQFILNGYLPFSQVNDEMNNYIVSPELGSDAGSIGSLLLAENAVHQVMLGEAN